jgi:hypothetical protein
LFHSQSPFIGYEKTFTRAAYKEQPSQQAASANIWLEERVPRDFCTHREEEKKSGSEPKENSESNAMANL